MRPRLAILALVAFVSWGLSSCSAVRPVADKRSPGYLTFEVTPADAEVYIDEEFRGQIDGWRGQTVPVAPGNKRVELRAAGYMTQRFDIEIAAGEQLTLELRLEREFDELELDPPGSTHQSNPPAAKIGAR